MSKYNRTIYIKEGIVAFLIVTLPFTIFLHLFYSDTDDYIMVFSYSYYHHYASAEIFMWIILSLLIPLFFLIIWFLECTYRWKWFILSPLIIRLSYLLKNQLYYPEIIENNLTLFALCVIIIFVFFLLLIKKYSYQRDLEKHPFSSLKANGIFFSKDIINSFLTYIKTKKESKYASLTHLVYLDTTISKEIKKHRMTRRNSILVFDIVIIFFIVLSSLLLYVELFFPEGAQFFYVLDFKIVSLNFGDVKTMSHVLFNKVSILLCLLIWFVTSFKWYKYALLSPIFMTAYQLWELFQPYKIIDEYSLFTMLPWIFGLSALLVFIGVKVNYVNLIIDYQKEISAKIDELITKNAKGFTSQEKESLSLINGMGNHKAHKFYKLEELLKLKQQLESKVKK